ncbi:Cornulin 53 kDa putative calcium-binding protein [Collichthys lucidus]|uniref:Cornulin 53 kDa putative calcium-binding protein n=1 Tax=Collichthys lucidus TaxID=240159 RepID=A0A4U5V2X6_COLLU|nr:Cornulin 53 kDa putative calcium-binding protein [Collichthys lucidus]
MPGLKNHIKGLKEVFDQYADSEGNLTKDQFKKLLETEIEDEEIKAMIAEIGVDKIVEKADLDNDGKYSFRELCLCAAYLGKHCKKQCGKKCDAK